MSEELAMVLKFIGFGCLMWGAYLFGFSYGFSEGRKSR